MRSQSLRGDDDPPRNMAIVRGANPWSAQSAKDRPRVLVVDDHFIIADTLADILNEAGFRATAVYGAKAALAIAERMHPHYLLADVVMPVMNGVELAIAIRQKLPATRILLLSGQTGISDILRQGRQEGYDFELLAKPIHPDKLLQRLHEISASEGHN